MIGEDEIDEALLKNVTHEWRKIALVVGMTMLQIESHERAGRDDLYFAKRLSLLAEEGAIEHKGDLNQIRECEVRLPSRNIC